MKPKSILIILFIFPICIYAQNNEKPSFENIIGRLFLVLSSENLICGEKIEPLNRFFIWTNAEKSPEHLIHTKTDWDKHMEDG